MLDESEEFGAFFLSILPYHTSLGPLCLLLREAIIELPLTYLTWLNPLAQK
jgi:hypothetical protein